jgi:hypothetical protein
MATTVYGLEELVGGQTGNATRYNDNLEVLACLTRKLLKDIGYTDSGDSGVTTGLADGDVFFVDGTGAGDWLGQDQNLAIRVNGGWKFATLTQDEVWFVQNDAGVSVDDQRKYGGGTTWSAL